MKNGTHPMKARAFGRNYKRDLSEAEEHFTNHLKVIKTIIKLPILPAKMIAELADSIIEFTLGMSLLHRAQDVDNYYEENDDDA